jgi:hypothetical protein
VVLTYEGSPSPAEAIARGSLLHNTALFMLYRGQWNKAEELQVQAAAMRKRVLGLGREVSFHTEQHGQSGVDVPESRMMDRG